MIIRGSRKAPVVLLIGFVVIIMSLVFVGVHRRSSNVVDKPAPLHDQK